MLSDYKEPPTTIAIFFMSILFMVGYTLAFNDPMYLAFAFPYLLFGIMIAYFTKGSGMKQKLKNAGVQANQKTSLYISFGCMGALAAIVIGSLIMEANIFSASLFQSSLSPSSTLVKSYSDTFSITHLVIFNILFQLFIVAPAEETGFRGVMAYASQIFWKNPIFNYLIANLVWVIYHIPTYTSQGASLNMYLVIFVWGIIFTILLILTQSFLTPIIAHGLTNATVILTNDLGINHVVLMSSLALISIVCYVYYEKTEGEFKMKIPQKM